ncbi:hypothetical protein J0S82_017896 [Galemys pyrenaicus]|uniref:Uncharacterized protein n=1 Tax=Galemys pyrenaicus TaxID=202257 RepID=A0A8J6A5K0_GALPY|nr:hypothetical protein J0S82_017896 [Galemys pyrenaicus]
MIRMKKRAHRWQEGKNGTGKVSNSRSKNIKQIDTFALWSSSVDFSVTWQNPGTLQATVTSMSSKNKLHPCGMMMQIMVTSGLFNCSRAWHTIAGKFSFWSLREQITQNEEAFCGAEVTVQFQNIISI